MRKVWEKRRAAKAEDRSGSRANAIAYLQLVRRDLREPPGSELDLSLFQAIAILSVAGDYPREFMQSFLRGLFGER